MNNVLVGKNEIDKSAKLVAFNFVENSKIGKNCEVFGSKITNSIIGDNVKIINSVVENSVIKKDCTVGPFAYLRLGTIIEKSCRIGDFVEIKNSHIFKGTKSAHLAYIGDSIVGKDCNIGCGTVFANYNGKIKQKILVEDNCFIGANVNLVAPLVVGKNSFIAAGTTVRKNVQKNSFVVGKVENKCEKNKN